MSQPGIDTPGPLSQIEFWEGWTINPLQSEKNITHFRLGVARNAAIGMEAIQPVPELQPHGFWLLKHIFERYPRSPSRSHQTQSKGIRRMGQLELIGQFFQENQVRH